MDTKINKITSKTNERDRISKIQFCNQVNLKYVIFNFSQVDKY